MDEPSCKSPIRSPFAGITREHREYLVGISLGLTLGGMNRLLRYYELVAEEGGIPDPGVPREIYRECGVRLPRQYELILVHGVRGGLRHDPR